MTDITINTDDEMKAKAEVVSSSSDYNATVTNILPVRKSVDDDEPIDSYDEIEIDDDEYSDYVSTPEGKALVERFFLHSDGPITLTEEESDIFYKECFKLTFEERKALYERAQAKKQ